MAITNSNLNTQPHKNMQPQIVYIPRALHARLRTHIILHGALLASGYFGGSMTISNHPVNLVISLSVTAIFTPTCTLLPS